MISVSQCWQHETTTNLLPAKKQVWFLVCELPCKPLDYDRLCTCDGNYIHRKKYVNKVNLNDYTKIAILLLPPCPVGPRAGVGGHVPGGVDQFGAVQ